MRRTALIWAAILAAVGAAWADDWWSFQPIRDPDIPPSRSREGPVHPIDALIEVRLKEAGLAMNPSATPRELVRRAYYDLLGLPPTKEEVDRFASEPTEEAWSRFITELLARPQYGERWGRHWLDVVRYAESNGYERDGAKPHAWRYRDYVIGAFNEDKPYDRFIIEQLAGDQLPGFDREALIATGFYRLHVWDDEPDSTLQAEFDDLDDIMVTASGAFMGLTMGCARCHEHKYDPITQREYYEMLAYFRGINPYGVHHRGGGGRGTGKITRYLATEAAMKEWEDERAARVAMAERRVAEALTEEERAAGEREKDSIGGERPPFEEALAVTEEYDERKPTHVLVRGQPDAATDEVEPGVPAVLGVAAPEREAGRSALAAWVTDPRNPLTARVMVNRVWLHHFGRGIVATPNDFGRSGAMPTHPELLDHLAVELGRRGGSLKRLHHYVMTSRAYRMSSRAADSKALEVDEGNGLYWRQNARRLEAEALRDSLLAFAGELNLKMGGPGVYPELPAEVHRTQDSVRKGWGESDASERNRRSVYLVVKRGLPHPFMEVFDYSNNTFPLPDRPVTTVAPQALMLLNGDLTQAQALRLAGRLEREAGPDLDAQVVRAFEIVLQRAPDGSETRRARKFIGEEMQWQAESNQVQPPRLAAMALFCAALINLNEAIYID